MKPARLYVAVSHKPPFCAWAHRYVRSDGSFEDREGLASRGPPLVLRLQAILSRVRDLADGDALLVCTTDAATSELVGGLAAVPPVPPGPAGPLVAELITHAARVSLSAEVRSRTGDPYAKDCKKRAVKAAERAAKAGTPVEHGVVLPRDVEAVAWTDGGARTNPGPAAWGFVMVHVATGATLTARDGVDHATNNRMELLAIAEALASFTRRTRVEIRTDSKFAISVCTEWRRGWKRRGWKRSNGDPPVNLDVIQRLDALLDRHEVRFEWVKGHAGDPGNELADQLCNRAIDDLLAGRNPEVRQRLQRPPF